MKMLLKKLFLTLIVLSILLLPILGIQTNVQAATTQKIYGHVLFNNGDITDYANVTLFATYNAWWETGNPQKLYKLTSTLSGKGGNPNWTTCGNFILTFAKPSWSGFTGYMIQADFHGKSVKKELSFKEASKWNKWNPRNVDNNLRIVDSNYLEPKKDNPATIEIPNILDFPGFFDNPVIVKYQYRTDKPKYDISYVKTGDYLQKAVIKIYEQENYTITLDTYRKTGNRSWEFLRGKKSMNIIPGEVIVL